MLTTLKKRFRSFLATVTRNKVNDFIRSRMAEIYSEKKAGESAIDSLQNINVPDIEAIINKEWELFVSNLSLKKDPRNILGRICRKF